jgi:Ca2+-binding RTX toxin-like protein
MTGGFGDDTYIIDDVGDVVYEDAGAGVDTLLTSIGLALGGIDIEHLIASGSDAISLTGNAGDNVLDGNVAANTLDGGAGADVLKGGSGNDTYYVDVSDDQVIEAAGGGIDTVIAFGSFSLSLDSEVEFLTAFNPGGIRLAGSNTANLIHGDSGADVLLGLGDNDTLYGGLGKDVLSGGLGKDVFVFDTAVAKKKNANIDTITDFNVKDDSIYLENAIFKGLGKKGSIAKPVKLSKDAFFLGNAAHDADDRIVVSKDGKVYYDADGSGAQAQIQIALIQPKKLKMTAGDFLLI